MTRQSKNTRQGRKPRRGSNSVVNLIRYYARVYGVDPLAAMAVASVEGGLRWGAVGDNGTSFGPFQLHIGGALPPGKGPAFANSEAGIQYAIRSMAAAGAKGKKGVAAISVIVRAFERPAAPGPEIQRAIASYKSLSGGKWPAGTSAAAYAGGGEQTGQVGQTGQQGVPSQPPTTTISAPESPGIPNMPPSTTPPVTGIPGSAPFFEPKNLAEAWQMLSALPLASPETLRKAQLMSSG